MTRPGVVDVEAPAAKGALREARAFREGLR
jgi:hypothetical protein